MAIIYSMFVYYFSRNLVIKSMFSFGFTKRTEAKKLQSSAIKDSDLDKKEETDYLVSVEDKEIKRFVRLWY